MTPAAGGSLAVRAVLAVLVRLLPAGFRDRQRAEWSADLADLATEGTTARWRYLLAAAWTLPALRALVRTGRTGRRARLGDGIRRLGRPDRRGTGVLAVLVALLAALYGAAGASRAGWEFAPPLPTGAQAEELKRTVFPGVAVAGGGAAPFWTISRDGEYVEYGAAAYFVEPTDPRDLTALTGTVRDRLVAAGWRVAGAAPLPTDTAPLLATRGGLTLTYTGGADFTVGRVLPPWMAWFAAGGAALGALTGWLLTCWASRRAREGSLAAHLAGMVAWPTVVVMLVLLYGRMLLVPFHLNLLYVAGGLPRWVGAVALVTLGIVVVLGRPPRRDRRLSPTPPGPSPR